MSLVRIALQVSEKREQGRQEVDRPERGGRQKQAFLYARSSLQHDAAGSLAQQDDLKEAGSFSLYSRKEAFSQYLGPGIYLTAGRERTRE